MSHVYMLEGIIFDSSLCSLSFSDQTIKLGFKEAAILSSLCERPFKVVERDELQDALWKGGAGADTNLNRAIYILRRKLTALNPEQSELIETIPRVGYILKCQVKIKVECEQARARHVINQKNSFEGCAINTAMINNGSIHNTDAVYTKENHQLSPIDSHSSINLNHVTLSKKIIVLALLSALAIGLFFLFTISDTLFHSSAKSSLQLKTMKLIDYEGEIIYPSGVNPGDNLILVRDIFKIAKQINIKYISVGFEYISLYQESGDSKKIYHIKKKNYSLKSIYDLLASMHKTSLNNSEQNKSDCVNGKIIILTNEAKPYLCLNTSSKVISNNSGLQSEDIITMKVDYFIPDGTLLFSKKLTGDLIKEPDSNSAKLNFHSMDFPVIVTSNKTTPYFMNRSKNTSMLGWNDIGKDIMLYNVHKNIYFSDAMGGRLAFADFVD